MKGLKKLILASAITAASTSAFAMQALDDEALSATTGQDGLTITLGTDINIGALRILDKDGLTGSNVAGTDGPGGVNPVTAFNPYFTTGGTVETAPGADDMVGSVGGANVNRGYILIEGGAAGDNGVNAEQGIALLGTSNTTLVIDTGSESDGSNPVLHIEARLGAMNIGLGGTTISVAGVDDTEPVINPAAVNATAILSFDAGTVLALGASTMNIDLGNQPTGALVWGRSTLQANGNGNVLELSSLNILQGANGIGLKDIAISPNTGTSVSTDIQLSVVAGGLQLSTQSVGGVGLDIAVGDITLGAGYATVANNSIGSVYIDNLRMGNNTITIAGH